MKFIERFKKISHLREEGDSLKLRKGDSRGHYYIEITPLMMKTILRGINGFGNKFIVVSNMNEVHIIKKKDLKSYMKHQDVVMGSVYTVDSKKMVAFDRKVFHKMIDTFHITPIKRSTINDRLDFGSGYVNEFSDNTNENKVSNSMWVRSKSSRTERFDWDEAYLEGLRIHGNKDDAEAHADDEESAFKGSN